MEDEDIPSSEDHRSHWPRLLLFISGLLLVTLVRYGGDVIEVDMGQVSLENVALRVDDKAINHRRGSHRRIPFAKNENGVEIEIVVANDNETTTSIELIGEQANETTTSTELIGEQANETTSKELKDTIVNVFDDGNHSRRRRRKDGERPVENLVLEMCKNVKPGWPENGTAKEKYDAAICGAAFDFSETADSEEDFDTPRRVALYGKRWGKLVRLSGCPVGKGKCQKYPNCEFVTTENREHVVNASVVVMTPEVAKFETSYGKKPLKNVFKSLTDENGHTQKKYNVFYWREPQWVISEQVQANFDFEMGIHFWSALLNPNFLRQPTTLFNTDRFEFVPFEKRTGFVMSAISDCRAPSMRRAIIKALSDILGEEKVHQYGNCGDRELPPKPINNALKVISTYKFYFSFENHVEPGYVTEKLFTILNTGVIPIYLGATDLVPITRKKSFLNIFDYKTLEDLADHMIYLANNQTAYMEYHEWRNDGMEAFTDEYLKLVAHQFPPQKTIKAYRDKFGNSKRTLRTLACCRLCSPTWVKKVAELPQPVAKPPWTKSRISRRFNLKKYINQTSATPGHDDQIQTPPAT